MRAILFSVLMASLLLLCSCGGPTSNSGKWRPLFNGKDLSGWKKLNGNADYMVKEGQIIGFAKLNTPNTFLATEEIFGDFILEYEVKVQTPLNSGVQIRSNSIESYRNGRVHGYQVELDPSARSYSGAIYDEARRGWLYPIEENPKARNAFKRDDWNQFRVEAIGSSIRTWVNGVPCVDLIDDMTAEGFIALQVHSINGKDGLEGHQVAWKNIRIQTENLKPSPQTDIPVINLVPNTLSPQEEAQGFKLLFDGKSTNGWRGVYKDAFPQKGWKVVNGALIVESSDGAESQNGGDIVTEEEFSAFELTLEFKLTPGANSGIKYFVTEQYLSDKSAIGLEYQILDDALHPDAKKGSHGNRTIASLYDLIPADSLKSVKKIGEWNHLRLIVRGSREEDILAGRNKRIQNSFKGAYVEHWLNHRKVLSYERGTQAFYALVNRSKYENWKDFGSWQSGHILLQDHGDEVHFRSIKIRTLE